VRDGADITIASTGPILAEALGAAELLALRGIDAGVLHFGTVKPIDVAAILGALARTGTILTLEEHSMIGGFGGAVAEVAAEAGIGRVLRAGFPDTFIHEVGAREHLLEHYGLDAAGVAARAAAALDIAPSPRRLTLQRGLA
jgi:transketolase